DLKPILDRYAKAKEADTDEAFAKKTEKFKADSEAYKAEAAKAKEEGKPFTKAAPRAPQRTNNNPNMPSVLWNGMVTPIIPYGIAGATWSEGEPNAGRATQYRKLLPAMIADWRKAWGRGDFPFMIVSLANLKARKAEPADSDWAELRDAQLFTS